MLCTRALFVALALMLTATAGQAQFFGPFGDPYYGPGFGAPFGPFGFGPYGDFGYAVPMYRDPGVIVMRPMYYVPPRLPARLTTYRSAYVPPQSSQRQSYKPTQSGSADFMPQSWPQPMAGVPAPLPESPATQPMPGVPESPATPPGPATPVAAGVETGLRVIEIGPGPAATAGLRVGDLILGINSQRTQTLIAARGVLAATPGPVPVDYIDSTDGQIKRTTLDTRGLPIGAVVVEAAVPQK